MKPAPVYLAESALAVAGLGISVYATELIMQTEVGALPSELLFGVCLMTMGCCLIGLKYCARGLSPMEKINTQLEQRKW